MRKVIFIQTRAHVLISGRVQGVWYRATTRDKAKQLGLTGWVKNTFDGKVEAMFEGEEDIIKEMIAWCREGPRLADVTDVKVDYRKATGEFQDFSVMY